MRHPGRPTPRARGRSADAHWTRWARTRSDPGARRARPPGTTPSWRTACQPSRFDRGDQSPELADPLLDASLVDGHGEGRHAGLRVRLQTVAHPLERSDQGCLVHELEGHRLGRLAVLAVQEEGLDDLSGMRIAHPDGKPVVEVLGTAPHAAEVARRI